MQRSQRVSTPAAPLLRLLETTVLMAATPTLASRALILAMHTTAQNPVVHGQMLGVDRLVSACRAPWQKATRLADAAPRKTAPAHGRRVPQRAKQLLTAHGPRLRPHSLEALRAPPHKTARLARATV